MHEPGTDDVGCAQSNRPPAASGEVEPIEEGGALVALRISDHEERLPCVGGVVEPNGLSGEQKCAVEARLGDGLRAEARGESHARLPARRLPLLAGDDGTGDDQHEQCREADSDRAEPAKRALRGTP